MDFKHNYQLLNGQNQLFFGKENYLIFKKSIFNKAVGFFTGSNKWDKYSEADDNLPKEYSAGQDIIGNRSRELDQQTESPKKRQQIANILGKNKVDPTDYKKLKSDFETTLNQLKTPVSNADNLRTSIQEIRDNEKLRERLTSPDLDQVDLNRLLDSDLQVLFDEKLRKKLEKSAELMTSRDRLAYTSKYTDPTISVQAEEDWKEELTHFGNNKKEQNRFKKDKFNWINRRVRKIEAERELWYQENRDIEGNGSIKLKKIDHLLDDGSLDENLRKVNLEKIANLKEDDEGYIALLKKQQSPANEPNRLHAQVKKIESNNLPLLGHLLDYEDKLKLTQLLLEVEQIKKRNILSYIQKKLNKISNQFHTFARKQPSRINLSHHQKISGMLAGLSSNIADESILKRDISILNQLNENIDLVTKDILKLDKDLAYFDELDKNPDDFKNGLKSKLKGIESRLNSPGHETELAKNQLSKLTDGLGKFDEVSPGKKDHLVKEINLVHSKLSQIDSEKARTAIEQIKDLSDPKAIEEFLIKLFGKERIDFTSSENFRNYGPEGLNLNEYTVKGNMVFYERGDEWKIVVDKEEIKDVSFLVKQLTHELRHLEFESNFPLKEKWRQRFTQNKGWNDIRQAFVDTFPDKKPPEGNEWQDDDILSELYAMQEDSIFKQPVAKPDHEKTPKDRLNQHLWDADHLGINSDKYRQTADEQLAAVKARGYDDADADATPSSADKVEPSVDSSESLGSSMIYKETIKKNEEEINNLLKSIYVGHIPGAGSLLRVMKNYNAETDELNNRFEKSSNAVESGYLNDTIKERIDEIKKDLTAINKEIALVGDKIGNTSVNPLRDLWNRTTILTPESFWQMGKDFAEWWDRQHKRKITDHAARIGTALADKVPLPWIEEFGMEAQAQKEKSEADEVEQWKGRINNKDAWELQGIIDQMAGQLTPNKDELKAVLRVLADKGRINWRDGNLWRVLNKLQGDAYLSPDDDILLKNPVLLRQHLHQAIGAIYDYGEFLDLERSNESNYESGKQKYEGGFNKIQDQVGDRMDQLLQRHLEDPENANVDPQEYEGLIDYCIKDSKAYAEKVMFHIISGIASGLLNPDRGLALDKDPNLWPATNWITSHKPPLTQKDYKYYVDTYFKDEYLSGNAGQGFIDFYWTVIQNNPNVISRTRKSVTDRKWDHDWGRAIACMGDANTAKQFLSGKSSQQETKDTAVENAIAGSWMWLQRNSKYPNRIDARKEFARQAGWAAMTDGILTDTAFVSNKTYARENGNMLSNVPREADVVNGHNWSTQQYLNNIRGFLDHLDGTFFGYLRDSKRAKSDANGLLSDIKAHLSRYPGLADKISDANDVDDIFGKIDTIVSHIVGSLDNAKFDAAMAYVQRTDATG